MLVNNKAPNFCVKGVDKNNQIIKFDLYKNISNKNILLFFWPLNFTFICPSEIIALNNRYKKFKKKNTKILGISIDSIYSHIAWKNTPINKGGIGNIKFNILSDINRKIIKLYNIKFKKTYTSLRSTFILDKNKIIRYQSTNDMFIGRNIDEILRIIDAINYNCKTKLSCPAQWNKNKSGIKENYEDICKYLKKNYKTI